MKETNTRLKANLQSNPLTGHEIIEIITVAKYLDNIQEPLGSIIRNSKPKNLEEAHQAVLLNQNAETRIKPQPHSNQNHHNKFKSSKPQNAPASGYHPPQTNTSHKNTSYKKQQFQPKPRAEANNNEVEEVEEIEPDTPLEENDDLEYSDEELNFQTAKAAKHPT